MGVAAGLGVLVTAAAALVLTQPWQADPFERFIAPDAVPADLASIVASFYQFESDTGAVVAAGPTLLYRADDLAVAAYIELDLESGTQSVCMTSMQFISPGASHVDGGRECTPRDEFETNGMTIGLSSRIEATANEPQSGLPFWLTWHPNDDVELHDDARDDDG